MARQRIDICLIMATHNGGERLTRTLDSFAQQVAHGPEHEAAHGPENGPKNGPEKGSAGRYHLIAVDNASSDDSAGRILAFKDRLPLTLLSETTPGKNAALNSGLRLALERFDAAFFLFIDDDIIAPSDWLKAWQQELAATPDFDLYGAFVAPDWPAGGAPDYILEGADIEHAYALHPKTLERGEIPYGTIYGNMMGVRARVFESGLRFNADIGPKAGKAGYVPGSESAFNMKASEAGFRAWMARDIVVKHQIRPEQLTTDWLMGRAFRLGRGQANWDRMLGHTYPSLWGAPRWAWRRILTAPIKAVVHKLLQQKAKALAAQWEGARARGMLMESRQLARQAD